MATASDRARNVLILGGGALSTGILWGISRLFGEVWQCPFKAITGLPCPGCGGVRAFESILRGDVPGALCVNPLSVLAMLFFAVSAVWLAVLLIFVFSVKLGWLPAVGGVGIVAFILPMITIGYPMAAELTRVARSGMIDTLGEDHIKATYARGVSKRVVNWKYAFRNAICPMITLVGMSMSAHIAGSIVVESIFALPGVGQLMYNAINRRDYPIVQGVLVVVAIMFALMNLIVDIINSFVDPRISLEG